MRVALLGPFALQPKGTVKGRILPLARALQRRGHQVLVVIPPWDNPSFAGQRLVREGITIAHIPLPPRFPLSWYPLITIRMVRMALSHQPDVIHAFKPKAFSGLAAMLLWTLKRSRLVRARLVMDTDDWEGPGGWNELAPYSPSQRAFFAFQERWGLSHAEAVTVASRALESMTTRLGVAPQRIFYVPNGVEGSPSPQPAKRSAHPTYPTILLYTRFFEFGTQRLLTTFQQVLKEEPQARLLVIGRGLMGEEEELDRQVAAAGLQEQVRLVGWVEPEQLPCYLSQAQVAIYPLDDTLVNRTKCPLKLVELLQAGLPVVAERVGQTAEYIVDGSSGLLVEPGDTAAFAKAITRLLKEPALAHRMGEAARARVLGEFHWDRLIERVEAAYQC
jgi:glycosyltransferase involved in cell wall biosynthesis